MSGFTLFSLRTLRSRHLFPKHALPVNYQPYMMSILSQFTHLSPEPSCCLCWDFPFNSYVFYRLHFIFSDGAWLPASHVRGGAEFSSIDSRGFSSDGRLQLLMNSSLNTLGMLKQVSWKLLHVWLLRNGLIFTVPHWYLEVCLEKWFQNHYPHNQQNHKGFCWYYRFDVWICDCLDTLNYTTHM